MDKDGAATHGSGDDKAQLGREDDTADGLVVACHDGSRGWVTRGGGVGGAAPFSHDALVPGGPVPEENGAVLGPRRHVEIGVHVVLRPRQASHHAVVTEHDLRYFSRVRRKHPVRGEKYYFVPADPLTNEIST